jgi:putative oxidoreductase
MENSSGGITPLIGRILMSAVFLVFGFLKITTFHFYVGMAAGKGMPLPTLAIAGAICFEVLGGLAILTGFQTRLVSWILFVYLIPTTLIFHNFWADQGALRAAMMTHFYKNLAIMGGLLFLAQLGGGQYSVDASRTAKA